MGLQVVFNCFSQQHNWNNIEVGDLRIIFCFNYDVTVSLCMYLHIHVLGYIYNIYLYILTLHSTAIA